MRLIENKQPRLQTKLRHVDIHHHWLRQEHQKGKLNLEWVDSKSQQADGFTKPLTCYGSTVS